MLVLAGEQRNSSLLSERFWCKTVPKLNIFTPCDRISIDPFTTQVTLSNVLEILFPVGKRDPQEDDPEPLQGQRFLYAPFFVVSSWFRLNGEHDAVFEQHVTITAPDQREVQITPDVSFKLNTQFHRVFQQVGAITARMTGIHNLTLKVRHAGEEQWSSVASYPLVFADIQDEAFESPDNDEETDEHTEEEDR